jgi:predicted ester cyclase
MANHTDNDLRAGLHDGLAAAARSRGAGRMDVLSRVFAPGIAWNGCHPLGRLDGIDAVEARFLEPLHRSFPDLERRDDVFLAGDFSGDRWISATGYYFGIFAEDWLGIPATGRWVALRFGEVYRLDAGRIAEAFVLFDLPDLMRQAGVAPWRGGAGIEGLVPGPATRDGVRLAASPARETARTFDLVMAMLGPLFERNRVAMGMERYWSPDMMWYGPALIGTTRGLDGFFRDHQTPWMRAFPDWQDGLEAPHFADGPYACYAGWPSIRATHSGPFCGLDPTGRTLDIRVMDWWRRQDGLLTENWVLLDFPDLFLQLGVDLFALMRERAGRRRVEQ